MALYDGESIFSTLGIGALPLFQDLADRFCWILNMARLVPKNRTPCKNWWQDSQNTIHKMHLIGFTPAHGSPHNPQWQLPRLKQHLWIRANCIHDPQDKSEEVFHLLLLYYVSLTKSETATGASICHSVLFGPDALLCMYINMVCFSSSDERFTLQCRSWPNH